LLGKRLDLHTSAKQQPGFSLTELVVAVAVAMVLMAVGLPMFLRFYHSYQVTNAAIQVRDYLRLARYEAIRLNQQACLQIQPSSTSPGMTSLTVNDWNSTAGSCTKPTNMTTLLSNSGNLVDGGTVPGTTTLISSALQGSSYATNNPSPSTSTILFDARGALVPPTSVNIFYLTSSLSPDAGYRAVFLLPAGSSLVWTSDATGNWQQLQ
jgi:type IV fimbrial biogenesis protein FimT